jgi:hypothetical protein
VQECRVQFYDIGVALGELVGRSVTADHDVSRHRNTPSRLSSHSQSFATISADRVARLHQLLLVQRFRQHASLAQVFIPSRARGLDAPDVQNATRIAAPSSKRHAIALEAESGRFVQMVCGSKKFADEDWRISRARG